MAGTPPDARLRLVSVLTAAVGREIDLHDPLAPVAWPDLPTVRAMVLHVGNVHRWVTAIVRTRDAVEEASVATTPEGTLRGWYEDGREALLETLGSSDPDEPCWVLGTVPPVVGFWRRRMIYENAKHLMDLRAAGGAPWTPAAELSAADYADGIDELLSVFLPRSRSGLRPLPAPVVLHATDVGRRWRIGRDWDVSEAPDDDRAARISAAASDLALALWERADLRDRGRFPVRGDTAAADALASTQIHPW